MSGVRHPLFLPGVVVVLLAFSGVVPGATCLALAGAFAVADIILPRRRR